MRNLVIFGSGGFAREVHQIVEDINISTPTFNFLGFLDDDISSHSKKIHDSKVLGGVEWLNEHKDLEIFVAVGVGNTAAKRKIVKKIIENTNSKFATLIHPRAWVGNRVKIEQGAIICAGTLITTDIIIGQHVIVNIGTTLGHDVKISDFVTIAPTANISGNVSIGEGADIGTGSTIIQNKAVGDWSIVGAGAVVVRDVEVKTTVVGAPAKMIKSRQVGWHLG